MEASADDVRISFQATKTFPLFSFTQSFLLCKENSFKPHGKSFRFGFMKRRKVSPSHFHSLLERARKLAIVKAVNRFLDRPEELLISLIANLSDSHKEILQLRCLCSNLFRSLFAVNKFPSKFSLLSLNQFPVCHPLSLLRKLDEEKVCLLAV